LYRRKKVAAVASQYVMRSFEDDRRNALWGRGGRTRIR
jgi:hypothetical protein